MTNMRRMTISVPEELDRRILALKKNDRFARCSYSEVARQVLNIGFEVLEAERSNEDRASA